MEMDESVAPTRQGDPKVGDLAQSEVPEANAAGAPQDGSAQQALEADEQVSDTDNDDDGEQDSDLALYPRD